MNNPESIQKIKDKRKNGWWITNGTENRYIHDEADKPNGWYRGLSRHKGVVNE